MKQSYGAPAIEEIQKYKKNAQFYFIVSLKDGIISLLNI